MILSFVSGNLMISYEFDEKNKSIDTKIHLINQLARKSCAKIVYTFATVAVQI